MEGIYNILNNEEISFYPTRSNYGIGSKKIISPKNIYMSFSPLSSNHRISFSNTIMIPSITIDSSKMYQEKNTSQNNPFFPSEKIKLSKRDNTRIKTDSSKEDKNNESIEKQVTKIVIENETDKIDETSNEIDQTNLENKGQKDPLEMNPFFLGGKYKQEKSLFENDNSEYESQKVEKILNKNKKQVIDEKKKKFLRANRELKKTVKVKNNKKLKNQIKKVKSYNLTKINKLIANLEKEEADKKLKKSKLKNKTDISKEKNNTNVSNKIYKHRNSAKNLIIETNKEMSYTRTRGNSFKTNSSLRKNRDNNIRLYKASLFNKKSSSNLKLVYTQFNKEKKDEIDKYNKTKNLRIKYQGISHKFLNMGLGIKSKEEVKFVEKKEENISNNKIKSKRKKSNMSINNKNINTTEKKKIAKNLDFDSALKNKKNLFKTQFNLFSPDKFTNTEFCGSDFLEYTLDCMELILKSDKAQKQTKGKVNLNFPKSKGNKPKKRIALFDLDETLVHCTGDIKLKKETYQHVIDVNLPGNKQNKVGINIRPLWKKTLNLIKKYYYIVVFTASHQAYADAVLNFMDPGNKYFKYRLYRNNCSLVDVEGTKFYVKDLDIFDESYDLKDIIIVDNSVLSFIYHLENGIPIVPYYSEDKDGSLYVVGLYLMHIYKENDLREANKKYINLESFLNEAKNRNESNNSNNEEESINDENKDNKEDKDNLDNAKDNSIKEEKKSIVGVSKTGNDMNDNAHRRCSFSVGNAQRKLISRSTLINMYYELNNNRAFSEKRIEELIEENSNKSVSIDEEENENKEKKGYKNISDLFFGKRLLTSDAQPLRPKKNSKSNNNLYDIFKINMIHSKFYHKFSEGNFCIK